jgi:hypothetical protein
MSSPNQLSLLRRTLAAIAAAALVFTASDAGAQGNKIKLNGGTKADECEFSSMSITPSGGVTVQCSGTTNPPPPPPPDGEIFVMSTAAMNGQPNSVVTFSVNRSGGSNAAFAATTVNFTYSGSGCAITGTYPVSFANGQLSSPIGAPLVGSGTCTATLSQPPSPGALGTPSATVITLPGGNPGTVPSGCPALPQDMLQASFPGLGNPILQMQKSGQIVSIPLPSIASSGQVSFGESPTASSPQPVTLEISINRCPGVIDTDTTNRCNIRSTNGNYNSLTWLTKPYLGRGGTIDSTSANNNGLCWTGTEQRYVNARWSYSSCGFGSAVCGFAVQYNLGGY